MNSILIKKLLGFTLIELSVVVIIISILSALGFVQYGKLIEREHGRNTFAYLRAIRVAELDYHIKNGQFTTDINNLDLTPGIFDTSNYFDISSISSDNSLNESFKIHVIRKSNARFRYDGSEIHLEVTATDDGVVTSWEGTSPIYENLK